MKKKLCKCRAKNHVKNYTKWHAKKCKKVVINAEPKKIVIKTLANSEPKNPY